MACSVAAAKHSCSSCRSSPENTPCVSHFLVLLLLLACVSGVPTYTVSEAQPPAGNSTAGSRVQRLLQQQRLQQEAQPQQKQTQQYHEQQHACAASPLNAFDPGRVLEGASGPEKGCSVLNTAIVTWGAGSSPRPEDIKVQRRQEASGLPADSSPSEGRKRHQQLGSTTGAPEDTAFATSDLFPRTSLQQQLHLQQQRLQKQQQQQQQQSQRAYLSGKTSGVFIAFRQLAAAAAAGAAAAKRKRSAPSSGPGLQSPTHRQQEEGQQRESLVQLPLLTSASRSSPPADAIKHHRATHDVGNTRPDVAAAAAASLADATSARLLEVSSASTSGARSPVMPAAVGMQHPLKAGQWQQLEDEVVPSAGYIGGSSAVWIMQWCYSLGSCTAAATHRGQVGPAALRGEAALDAAETARCHCVASRMPVLLRDQPSHRRQRGQQHQQQQEEVRVITVLQQRLLLLCCTEGSYPPQLRSALHQELEYHMFRAATAKRDPAVVLGTGAALGKAHPANKERGGENVAASGDETTPHTGCEDTAETTSLKGAAAEPAATTDSLPSPLATDGARQEQHKLHLRQDEGRQSLKLSSQSDGERGGEQAKSGKPEGVHHQKQMKNKQQQRQEHHSINQHGEQQHELSSKWGGQLVSWTWRRSCMRQRQPLEREAAAAAEGVAVAAAALCYRPPAPTSLALQLLLLLLPHDLAVRLLANTTAQCQQPQRQQQPHQVQQAVGQQVDTEQPGKLLRREEPKRYAAHQELHYGSCAPHAEGLRSGNSCAVLFDGGSLVALEFAGAVDESEQQEGAIDGLGTQKGMRSELHSKEQQQDEQLSRQHVKQQQDTQQHDNIDGRIQEGQTLQEDRGSQQLQERKEDAQTVAVPQRHSRLDQEQQRQKELVKQQQNLQEEDGNAAKSAAPAAAAAGKFHANSQDPLAKSVVGGILGAPQLYGRGFVQGKQLPASFLRLHFNFASLDAGARVIASSPGMQHIKAVQVRPHRGNMSLILGVHMPTCFPQQTIAKLYTVNS